MTAAEAAVPAANRGVMIDAPDTGDRDDAIWVRAADHGYDVWVHVAAVAEELAGGSAGDHEARRRVHSRYLPDRTIGMLPRFVERRASLRSGATQNTCLVQMRFDGDGELADVHVGSGQLREPDAVSYAEAVEILGDDQNRLHVGLSTAHELARLLLTRRRHSGALAFYDLFKGYATNEEGQLIRLGDNQRNSGYVIVQELMIAANAAAATWCASRDLPMLFRNHRAAAVGGSREDLVAELHAAEARGDPAGYELLGKRMDIVQRPATYEPKVMGHHGLSLPVYAHTTSPLRRYPDLVNQRILLAAAAGKPSPYSYDELAVLGEELNSRIQQERERRAERYRAVARRATHAKLAASDYTTLEPAEFAKVLRLALSRPAPPAELVTEAARRFETGSLPLRDACEVLFAGDDEQWSRLRGRIHQGLADEPSRAVTVMSMYAQAVLGGPLKDSHLQWRIASAGTDRRPCFEAELRLELGEVTHASPPRVQLSKREAKGQAALALTAQLCDLPDLSHSVEVTADGDMAASRQVPADRNPVAALHEYVQMGVVTALDWTFERQGPPHEPEFSCTAHAAMPAGGSLQAAGVGRGKQSAKTAAATRLRALVEAGFDSGE